MPILGCQYFESDHDILLISSQERNLEGARGTDGKGRSDEAKLPRRCGRMFKSVAPISVDVEIIELR